MPRLLVTGFSAFPGARRNPTEALVGGLEVKRLAARLDIELATAVLPTEYAAVSELLPRLWAEIAPDAVLHFGLAGRAARVRVERRARNRMSPVRPDAARQRPARAVIEPAGPAVRQVNLPVPLLVAELGRRGIRAAASNDAGDYLCNFASYLSLGLAGREKLAGFIHLPWPAEERACRAPAGRPSWAHLALAVETAIAVTAIAARNAARG